MGRNYDLKTVICGGVIISPWYILTAAHCVVRKLQVIKYELLVGTVSEYITKQHIIILSSSDVIAHPRFQWKGTGKPKHDIAMLRLPKRLKFGYNIQPICLPSVNQINIFEKNCEFAGWGRTINSYYHSQQLNTMPARLRGHCDNSKSIICVTYKGKSSGACKGDSGSPLVHKGADGRRYLVSLLSYGSTTCPSTVDGHIYIQYYRSWIKKVLKNKNENLIIDNS